jgi:hypothetical protein
VTVTATPEDTTELETASYPTDLTDRGGKPVSQQGRTRDLLWLGKGLNQMKTFSGSANCQKDLDKFGLTSAKVDSLASNTTLQDYNLLPADAQDRFDPGADMTAVSLRSNFIVYNQDNFWQSTYSQILGSVLHEMIHLSNMSLTDKQIGNLLGATVTDTDTSQISITLANDCFPNAQP